AATVAYVREAVHLHRCGRIAAIAAAPHSETAVNASGTPFNGYAGLLADLTGTPRDQVFLMLEARGLRVVHCTLHEGVRDAVARITPALVESAAQAARATLPLLGVREPSLCVLGINPHAGEGGLFGSEDERVTKPAVQAMRAKGWKVDGPVGADLALSERKHDAYVAMLHDQGHIAVKMLSPKGASAIAAGLPVLFSSVGHGAAFDLAGKGRADASAMTDTLAMLQGAIA
ncbi:MAG: 4-hydroxythreonine-4-phosphate dehydrogenase PdxA, partial [Frateuria sp.]|nr:4-hydroxythreonine-4-phosphate dehydrogenase PdxA [Frateuria sp.]